MKIKKVACGQQHVAVLTEEGAVYSWGFGGYGRYTLFWEHTQEKKAPPSPYLLTRLGLGDAKDYYKPQRIGFFQGQHYSATDISCGQTATYANTRVNALYMWGKFKNTGDGSGGQPWYLTSGCTLQQDWALTAVPRISGLTQSRRHLPAGTEPNSKLAQNRPYNDLSGWKVQDMSAGAVQTFFIAGI